MTANARAPATTQRAGIGAEGWSAAFTAGEDAGLTTVVAENSGNITPGIPVFVGPDLGPATHGEPSQRSGCTEVQPYKQDCKSWTSPAAYFDSSIAR
jgi:hypothetical protein